MKLKIPSSLENVLAILLGAAAAITVGLHIWRSSAGVSQMEATLFSILQFVFSIGFAFVLARITSHREFTESQKQFAIAAYRRIKEIEKAIDRLLVRTSGESRHPDRDVALTHEIARGIRESIASSIADWGDIIGEEIVAVERIERSRRSGTQPKSDRLAEKAPTRPTSLPDIPLATNEMERVIESLPYPLRIMSAEATRAEAREAYVNRLREEVKESGGVNIACYVDGDVNEEAFTELRVGDNLAVSIGDLPNRIGTLIARDQSGRPVGVLMNNSEGDYDYDDFVREFINAMNSSQLEGEVAEICDADATDDGHECHFRIQVFPSKSDALVSVEAD